MSEPSEQDWSLSHARALRLILAGANVLCDEPETAVGNAMLVLEETMAGGEEEMLRVVIQLALIAISALLSGYDEEAVTVDHDAVIKVLEADLLKRLDEIAEHDMEIQNPYQQKESQ